MNIIAETNVGSHVWKMNHKGSDIDLFQIYVEPTKDVLNGTAKKKSYFNQKNGIDIALHEAEPTINQLMKGNINFIVGVCSPLINKTSREFEILRNITLHNLSKNCFHSIHGMAVNNYEKFGRAEKLTEKKWNQLVRVLDFGIRVLNGEGVRFDPVTGGCKEVYVQKLDQLAEAFNTSKLPERPNIEVFRTWLYDVRLVYMENKK